MQIYDYIDCTRKNLLKNKLRGKRVGGAIGHTALENVIHFGFNLQLERLHFVARAVRQKIFSEAVKIIFT